MINGNSILFTSLLIVSALILAGIVYVYRMRGTSNLLLKFAESVDQVFWITDRSWKKVYYISPSFEKVWGRTCSELYRSPSIWLESVHLSTGRGSWNNWRK
jgi:hypothetical protein